MIKGDSHWRVLRRGLQSAGASVALALTISLGGLVMVSLLASARTGSVLETSRLEQQRPLHEIRQVYGAGQVDVARLVTEPMTTTAALPVILNGFPPSYAWTGEVVATYPNCTLTRLFGFVRNQAGELQGDVWVHVWADNFDGFWYKSSWEASGDHNWDGTLDNRPREVIWYACIVDEKQSWECLSNTVAAGTSADCQTGIQVYQIDFRLN